MKRISAIVVALVVFGVLSSFLIATGKWNSAVIAPIRYVIGVEAADTVDRTVRGGLDATDQFIDDARTSTVSEVLGQLGAIALPVVERAPKYEREQFGDGWQSDMNGCSTRDQVLMRDLQSVIMRADRKCKVESGILNPDPYTGKVIELNSIEDPMTVQIDHVVPLSVAWQMGAWKWDSNQRVAFSNDLENLLAADGPANNSKGDRTPERWMPSNTGFQCEYASKYTHITTKYGLAMDATVKDKLVAVLENC